MRGFFPKGFICNFLIIGCLVILLIGSVLATTKITAAEARTAVMTSSADDTQVYTNEVAGYQLILPGEALIDTSKGEAFVAVTRPNYNLKIFYDDFTNSPHVTVKNLILYGNRDLEKSGKFKVTANYYLPGKQHNARVTTYTRERLAKLPADLPYYTSIIVPRNEWEAVTLLIKTAQPLKKAEISAWVQKLTWVPRVGGELLFKETGTPAYKHLDEATRKFFTENFGDEATLKFGIYQPDVEDTENKTADLAGLKRLETRLDYRFPFLLSYSTTTVFKDGFGDLKQNLFKVAAEDNRTLLLTLTTFEDGPGIETQTDCTLDLLQGKYDDVLMQYAQAFKQYGRPVLLRINNEMNGDWVLYCNQFLGKDPDLFVSAYRYIHDFFTAAGVKNVIYVFNPNEKSFPDFSYNHYLAYYPGQEYVDLIGLTAYNTGCYYPGENWRNFQEMYQYLYNDYERHFRQPFIITEFSSAEVGGDKLHWFENMFADIRQFDRIKLAVLWNGTDWDRREGALIAARQYRIDGSQALIKVITAGLQDLPQAAPVADEAETDMQNAKP